MASTGNYGQAKQLTGWTTAIRAARFYPPINLANLLDPIFDTRYTHVGWFLRQRRAKWDLAD